MHVEGEPYANVLSTRCFAFCKAARSEERIAGHYGLAAVITRTSPIRRYPDLPCSPVWFVDYGRSKEVAEHLNRSFGGAAQSQIEAFRAIEAEREVELWKKLSHGRLCWWKKYDAVVSVSSNLVFVELPNTVETNSYYKISAWGFTISMNVIWLFVGEKSGTKPSCGTTDSYSCRRADKKWLVRLIFFYQSEFDVIGKGLKQIWPPG